MQKTMLDKHNELIELISKALLTYQHVLLEDTRVRTADEMQWEWLRAYRGELIPNAPLQYNSFRHIVDSTVGTLIQGIQDD